MATLNGGQTQESDDDGDGDSDEGDGGETALLNTERRSCDSVSKRALEETTSHFVRGILVETVPTLVFATIGLTFTGELLERVSDWRALKRINELYILIPMLNNLKGNLEMNLSSRLSTAANIGDLDVVSTRRALLLGNLSLLQVQALIVSAIAALLSFLLGLIIPSTPEAPAVGRSFSVLKRRPSLPKPPALPDQLPSGLKECVILVVEWWYGVDFPTSMASASISGLVLGSFMCALILLCRMWNRNPDNITPPIASCLGDLLTLCIIGLVSSILIRTIDTALPIILLVAFGFCTAFSIILTLRNQHARPLIFLGWTPLLGAMVISSGAGFVLEQFVNQYDGFGLLSIVVGGLPGAVGSVHVSRLSTYLHASASKSFIDEKSTHDSRTTVTLTTLFLVTLPVSGLFLACLHLSGWMKLSFIFVAVFTVFFCLTVAMSLVVAHLLTQFLWRRNLDPDTYAMPIQSSLVDLLGQLMLVACFELAHALGANVKNIPTP
ncbi:hypothetical protein K439DRAFT_1612498 [Ramaria rubella]|nr:hypothetical protein K439DRAFT_1612498 [Ramaria rubella]